MEKQVDTKGQAFFRLHLGIRKRILKFSGSRVLGTNIKRGLGHSALGLCAQAGDTTSAPKAERLVLTFIGSGPPQPAK